MKRLRIRKIRHGVFLTLLLRKHSSWLVFELRRFLLPLVAFGIIMTVLVIISTRDISWVGWKLCTGFPYRIFCEGVSTGSIRQPINAWSSVAFIPIGLWVVKRAYLDYQPLLQVTPVKRNKTYGIVYGLALVIMGGGSWMFHASLTYVGHFMDVVGMYFLGGFLFTYGISRRLRQSPASFVLFYLSVVSPLVVFQWFNPAASRYAFAALILTALGVEFVFHKSFKSRHFQRSIIALAMGFGIWILDEKKLLCQPDSCLQGHALWHILTAVSTLFAYLHFRSENPQSTRGTSLT